MVRPALNYPFTREPLARMSLIFASFTLKWAGSPTTRDLCRRLCANRRLPISMATRASFYIAVIRLRSSQRNAEQKQRFKNLVTHHTMVHEQERTFFQGFPRDSHPMAILTGCVGALSAF